MVIIGGAQVLAGEHGAVGVPDRVPDADPRQAQAAQVFAGDLAAGRVSSVRAARARLHAGRPRAQRVRAYLAALTSG